VLGLIAALALPSIFNSVKTKKDVARFREAYSAIVQAGYQGHMNGDITSRATYIDYMSKNLNVIALCNVGEDAPSKPCNINNLSDRTASVRMTLNTGVTYAILNSWDIEWGLATGTIHLDANNGPAAPADAWLAFNYSDTKKLNTSYGTTDARPGETVPVGAELSIFQTNFGL